jgi:PAS domain S-box-containing protein
MLQVDATNEVAARSAQLFDEHRRSIYRRTDRTFAWLMIVQFFAGILAAFVISPKAWSGPYSTVHPHVVAAVILGFVISAVPVALAFIVPGRLRTRMAIACGQMLASALLIHLTGGRIETHFHVFGSLAILAIYRDWRVFVPATAVVALDHLIRGVYWPESVYGVLAASPWRSIEHALWVVFENIFLIRSCIQGVREMKSIAQQRAELEQTNARIEREVHHRTAELTRKTVALEEEVAERAKAEQALAEMNVALSNAMPGISRLDDAGHYAEVNDTYARMLGYTPDELIGVSWEPTLHPEDRARAREAYATMLREGISECEARALRKDGSSFFKHVMMVRISSPGGAVCGHHCFMRDISERKQAEAEREELNRRLVETSRYAGMAEIATGVLHNVGNVLNSVNVSAALVTEKVRSSEIADLEQLARMLQEHSVDLGAFVTSDERGRLIPAYLSELGTHLMAERQTLLEELGALTKNIDHITDIVRMQQAYARVSGVLEPVVLSELVDDAIHINTAALHRHGVRVVSEYEPTPPITLDKHRVLQILVNLISNAKYAMDETDSAEKVLTLRIERDLRTNCVRVIVRDTGVGISAQNLTRIFSHGFTTRKHGHGFGLHSCSLAAKAMGGSLSVSSAGPSAGATFILELPAEGAAVEHGSLREEPAYSRC